MAAQDAREMLVHRWVSGSFSNPGELVRRLRAAGIPCDGRQRYLGLIVRIDSYRNQRQRLGMEKLYLARQTLLDLCSAAFPRGYCCMETDTYIAAVLTGQGYIVLLAIAVFSQSFALFGKFEKSDEMAVANLNEAKAEALDITRILLLIVSVILIMIPDEMVSSIGWSNIVYPAVVFMVGLPEVITGLMFKRIEEE